MAWISQRQMWGARGIFQNHRPVESLYATCLTASTSTFSSALFSWHSTLSEKLYIHLFWLLPEFPNFLLNFRISFTFLSFLWNLGLFLAFSRNSGFWFLLTPWPSLRCRGDFCLSPQICTDGTFFFLQVVSIERHFSVLPQLIRAILRFLFFRFSFSCCFPLRLFPFNGQGPVSSLAFFKLVFVPFFLSISLYSSCPAAFLTKFPILSNTASSDSVAGKQFPKLFQKKGRTTPKIHRPVQNDPNCLLETWASLASTFQPYLWPFSSQRHTLLRRKPGNFETHRLGATGPSNSSTRNGAPEYRCFGEEPDGFGARQVAKHWNTKREAKDFF